MKTWPDYYYSRVNSKGYEHYFQHKYSPLITNIMKHIVLLSRQLVDSNAPQILIMEEGCGIGSVTKQLLNRVSVGCPLEKVNFVLMDSNAEMLELAKLNLAKFNNNNIIYKQKDIFAPVAIDPNDFCHKIIITHGVLEHFTTIDITRLFKQFYESKAAQFHYVPLDGYTTPSFGDEHLYPITYWGTVLDNANIPSQICHDTKDAYISIQSINKQLIIKKDV